MDLLLGIIFMFLLGWIAIKLFKVVAWVVIVLIVANLLSSVLGGFLTIVILVFMLFNRKVITSGLAGFLFLAFLLGVIF